jgi:hypothetical protein
VADPAPPAGWTTCLTCGDATAPGALRCPTCGAPTDGPEAARAGPRRLKVHRWLRISLVLAVAAGLSGVLLLAFVQGPPVAADPLTGSRTFSVAAGGYQFFSGAVTGGDYVTGNFTVLSPPGAQLVFAVYNSTARDPGGDAAQRHERHHRFLRDRDGQLLLRLREHLPSGLAPHGAGVLHLAVHVQRRGRVGRTARAAPGPAR